MDNFKTYRVVLEIPLLKSDENSEYTSHPDNAFQSDKESGSFLDQDRKSSDEISKGQNGQEQLTKKPLEDSKTDSYEDICVATPLLLPIEKHKEDVPSNLTEDQQQESGGEESDPPLLKPYDSQQEKECEFPISETDAATTSPTNPEIQQNQQGDESSIVTVVEKMQESPNCDDGKSLSEPFLVTGLGTELNTPLKLDGQPDIDCELPNSETDTITSPTDPVVDIQTQQNKGDELAIVTVVERMQKSNITDDGKRLIKPFLETDIDVELDTSQKSHGLQEIDCCEIPNSETDDAVTSASNLAIDYAMDQNQCDELPTVTVIDNMQKNNTTDAGKSLSKQFSVTDIDTVFDAFLHLENQQEDEMLNNEKDIATSQANGETCELATETGTLLFKRPYEPTTKMNTLTAINFFTTTGSTVSANNRKWGPRKCCRKNRILVIIAAVTIFMFILIGILLAVAVNVKDEENLKGNVTSSPAVANASGIYTINFNATDVATMSTIVFTTGNYSKNLLGEQRSARLHDIFKAEGSVSNSTEMPDFKAVTPSTTNNTETQSFDDSDRDVPRLHVDHSNTVLPDFVSTISAMNFSTGNKGVLLAYLNKTFENNGYPAASNSTKILVDDDVVARSPAANDTETQSSDDADLSIDIDDNNTDFVDDNATNSSTPSNAKDERTTRGFHRQTLNVSSDDESESGIGSGNGP